MKCKVFNVHPQNDSDETRLNEFLETVVVRQVFASIPGGENPYWSVLIFYDDATASAAVGITRNLKTAENPSLANILTPELTKPTLPKREVVANPEPEPIKLTAEQENSYNALRAWRNDRASRDGVPPYLIAHNDSLMQMATMRIETPEDLLLVKGLGEKRVEKYGEEILRILTSNR